ncbi:phosphatase PAP2 family protein [Mesorhizobium sp. CAU 1741]|uniref:phosphatase PAP2 family protein n=1 Tax=Mesorhizobium sp. CAU 1741 TaxID=3140366 RepID=UPI00325AD8B7
MSEQNTFLQAERLVQRITLATIVLCMALIMIKGIAVDVPAYGSAVGTGLLLITVGMIYRRSGRDQRIGSTAICAGWFILFTLSLSLFNYLLMPHWAPTIDVYLAEIDLLLFGYHWPDFVRANAANPIVYEAMRYAYLSTLPQIACLLIALGLSGRTREMYGLTTTVTLAGTMTIVIWGVVPSLGPSALYELPAMAGHAPPVVEAAYGREIARLFAEGATILSPDEIRGLIAFPSFHIVLAMAAVVYSRRVAWLFPLFLAVNLLVLPGVLVHGGHHVIDIPAGMLVFAVAMRLSRQSVPQVAASPSQLVLRSR